VVVFAILFYIRFNKQMVKEEVFLTEHFGDSYAAYCQQAPRIFPRLSDILKIKIRDVFNVDEMMSTKEKRGLYTWPILAVVLETIQEKLVFGMVDVPQTVFIFLAAFVAVVIGFAIRYQ